MAEAHEPSIAARIKAVHITTVHRPFDARIFHKQCVSLADAGFDVTLIQGGETDEVRENVKIVPLGLIEGRIRRTTLVCGAQR